MDRQHAWIAYARSEAMVKEKAQVEDEIRELTEEEWNRSIDRAARYHLGISGPEFVRRWNAGYYGDWDDDPRATRVAFLLPLDR
jgi:hypothetical protein